MSQKSNFTETLLGAHMSIAGGLHRAIEVGESIGCTTMQIFTKNNKAWFGSPLDEKEVILFKETLKKSTISKPLAHTSYLINLGSKNPLVANKSVIALIHELHRCEQLSIPYLVLHPGAHVGSGEEKSLLQISANLDLVLKKASGTTMILLENTAGQGTNVGYKFEQLNTIISRCAQKDLLGVCFDTCHGFAAGYPIHTTDGYKKTWLDFDKIIGLKKLKALHINDSKSEYGSRKDRHENIGKGLIPLTTFELLMNDARFVKIPKVLETPSSNGVVEYQYEIGLLRNMIKK